MRKKRLTNTLVKKLQNKAEKLWKECVALRDGKEECQVQKNYPQIDIRHAGYLQADHCFSRGTRRLFLEVANGTIVCGSCNGAKHRHQKSVCRAIDEIVIKREGQDIFDRMREMDEGDHTFLDWSNPLWLESQIEILEQLKKEIGDGVI